MAEAKTIDDYGPEAYHLYAESQALHDSTLIHEAKIVSKLSSKDVTKNIFSNQLDTWLETSKQSQWSIFTSPKDYESQQGLYSYQAIPSIESEEKRLLKMEEIKQQVGSDFPTEESIDWSNTPLMSKENKDAAKILDLNYELNQIDRNIAIILPRRSQYSKG